MEYYRYLAVAGGLPSRFKVSTTADIFATPYVYLVVLYRSRQSSSGLFLTKSNSSLRTHNLCSKVLISCVSLLASVLGGILRSSAHPCIVTGRRWSVSSLNASSTHEAIQTPSPKSRTVSSRWEAGTMRKRSSKQRARGTVEWLASARGTLSMRTRRWHVAVVSVFGRGESGSRSNEAIAHGEVMSKMRFSLGRGVWSTKAARRARKAVV